MSSRGLPVSPAPSTPSPEGPRPAIGQGGRLVVAIGADSIGSRVSVRYLLVGTSPHDPDVLMTDVVGVLEDWTEGVARIRRASGERVDVPIGAIVAAKVVPPAPPRRSWPAP